MAQVLIRCTGLKVVHQRKLLHRLAAVADPSPRSLRAAKRAAKAAKRARNAAFQEAWRRRQRAGLAVASVRYNANILGRLIWAGWLPRDPEELYSIRQVGAAISDLLANASELPVKPARSKKL